MRAKVLVTGGGGYIGSVGVNEFLELGHKVVVVDNFSAGYREPLELLVSKYGKEKISIYEADLTDDISHIFEKENDIEAVVHYAGVCSVDESMHYPEKYFRNNTEATISLLSAMEKFKVSKIIFSSSCAVYGEVKNEIVAEDTPCNPVNPYGESKKMAEDVIRWHGKRRGLKYVILRYFNVCGASDDSALGDSKNPSIQLVQNAVRGGLGISQFYLTCPTVDTFDTTPIRDYLNVVDLNLAHIKAFEYLGKGGESEVINLGTGVGYSVLEVVGEVERALGVRLEILTTEARSGEYSKMVASNKKAHKLLGWKPERSLEQSIKSLVTWYKSHPDGWER